MLVLLKRGKIQTLAPGATAPEYRAQHPKTKLLALSFEAGLGALVSICREEPQTFSFLHSSVDRHRGLLPLNSGLPTGTGEWQGN